MRASRLPAVLHRMEVGAAGAQGKDGADVVQFGQADRLADELGGVSMATVKCQWPDCTAVMVGVRKDRRYCDVHQKLNASQISAIHSKLGVDEDRPCQMPGCKDIVPAGSPRTRRFCPAHMEEYRHMNNEQRQALGLNPKPWQKPAPKPEQEQEPTGPTPKHRPTITIDEMVREAERRGISYGKLSLFYGSKK